MSGVLEWGDIYHDFFGIEIMESEKGAFGLKVRVGARNGSIENPLATVQKFGLSEYKFR